MSNQKSETPVIDLSTSDELCGICGDGLFTKFSISLPCNHNYHYECIYESCSVSKSRGRHRCPYCGYNYKLLEPVNGLKSLKHGVHWDIHKPEYENIKCNHILTRGGRSGDPCGKSCQTGYYKCVAHNKELKTIIKEKCKGSKD